MIAERHHQHAGAEEHQRVRRVVETPNERRDGGGAHPRAERLADADERKQPAALPFRVEVVRERPELRHDEDVDEADPDVEGDAFAQPDTAADVEADERRARRTSSRSQISRMRTTRVPSQP